MKIKNKVKVLNIVFGIMLIISCDQKNTNEEPEQKTSRVNPSQTNVSMINSQQVVPIPFGSSDTNSFRNCEGNIDNIHYHLLYEFDDTIALKLPKISKFNYIISDSLNKNFTCSNGTPVSDLFSLTNYKIKLPDLGEMAVYYSCGSYDKNPDYLIEYNDACFDFIYDEYGFLTFYNPTKEEAIVFCVFLNKQSEGAYYSRRFYIDQDYTISVCNVEYSEGTDKVDSRVYSNYKINLYEDYSYKIHDLAN